MANFYGTPEGFNTYCTQRNYTVPTSAGDPDALAAALLVASEWIDGKFRSTFARRTYKTHGRAQVREWPRAGFVDAYGYAIGNEEIPRELESATYEVALRELQAPGSLIVDYTPAKYSSVSISGAVAVQYRDGSALDFQKQIPVVNSLLSGLLGGSADNSPLSGDVGRV